MKYLIGKEFICEKNYPMLTAEELENCGYDVIQGETVKVIGIDDGNIQLENTSLGCGAWFTVDEEEFNELVKFKPLANGTKILIDGYVAVIMDNDNDGWQTNYYITYEDSQSPIEGWYDVMVHHKDVKTFA